MRTLLFNLHLYVSLMTAAFAIILAVTGSIIAFEAELDHLFDWRRSMALACVTMTVQILSGSMRWWKRRGSRHVSVRLLSGERS